MASETFHLCRRMEIFCLNLAVKFLIDSFRERKRFGRSIVLGIFFAIWQFTFVFIIQNNTKHYILNNVFFQRLTLQIFFSLNLNVQKTNLVLLIDFRQFPSVSQSAKRIQRIKKESLIVFDLFILIGVMNNARAHMLIYFFLYFTGIRQKN